MFRTLARFFLCITILFIICAVGLKHGIAISQLDVGFAKLEGFYLKLNKGLVLRIKNLEITQNNTQNLEQNSTDLRTQSEKILEFSKKISLINSFFEEIDVQNLKIKGESLKLKYKSDVFYADTRFFRLNSQITPSANGLNFDPIELELNDFNLTLHGTARANFRADTYDFNGTFASHEIAGELDVHNIGSELNIEINRASALSLKNFMNELGALTGLNPLANEWIYGKAVAQNYYIENLHAKVDLKDPRPIAENVSATAYAQDLTIKFQPQIEAVTVKDANITLKNDYLSFTLNEPKFKGKSLEGSGVRIGGLFEEKPIVYLDLRTKESLGKDLIAILQSYGIDEPVYPLSGGIDARVLIDVDVEKESAKVDANVTLKDADLMISKAKFHSKAARVHITEKKIDIKDANLQNEIFNATASGSIDIATRKAKFNGIIHSFNLSPNGKEILKFGDARDNMSLDFSGKAPVLSSQFLGAKMSFGERIEISSPDISGILPFSKTLKNAGISGGDLKILTSDFTNLDISSSNLIFDFGLLNKDGSHYKNDSFALRVRGGDLDGSSGSGKISLKINKSGNFVALKDVDVAINTSVQTSEFNSGTKERSPINFSGQNSAIVLSDLNKTLKFTHFNGVLDGKNMNLNASFKRGDVKLIFKKSLLQIFAQNISGEALNQFLGSQSFDGGVFTLKASGIDPRNYRGEINVQNTYLKDYIIYQRLLSFINSVPSLLTFKTPDFNDRGFSVQKGKIYFRRSGDKIYINAMNFTGSSADIAGNGEVDMKSGALNIDLELKYLKDASSIISKIPLLNHIILGENNTISTIIEIRGTTKKPTYSTGVATDVLKTPYNLIKNTLMLPFVIFGDNEESK